MQKKKRNQFKYNLFLTLPKNLEEEIQKFFDNGCQVNPQFEYESPCLTSKFLAQFKNPSDEHMQIATKIINSFLQTFGSETEYLRQEGGIITQEETEEHFLTYLEELDI